MSARKIIWARIDRIEGLFGSIEAKLNQAADDKNALISMQREEIEAKMSRSVLMMIERSECS